MEELVPAADREERGSGTARRKGAEEGRVRGRCAVMLVWGGERERSSERRGAVGGEREGEVARGGGMGGKNVKLG